MRINKKILYIAGFYVVSFILTLILANYIFNYDRIHPSRNQGDTSLIKLSVKTSGLRINEMDGYLREMEAAGAGQSVTPLSENKTLTLQVDEPENKARRIQYELMDGSGTEQIETGEFPEIQRVEGLRQTETVFNAELEPGSEYCLKLTVEDDQRQSFYYYTRLIYGNDLMAYDKIQFAMDFHSASFEKTAAAGIAEHLKTSSDGINNDFRKVTIESNDDTVTWGDLAPEIVGDAELTVLDLDNQTGEIRIVYEIVARDDGGNDYYYTVQEDYRLASSGSRVELLDYSRTMEEKLDDQSFYFDGSRLRLGIVDENQMDIRVYGKEEPEEAETEADTSRNEEEEYNTYISFAADGALWVYNMKDNILTQAFGFEGEGQTGSRDKSYQNHGVKVLRTEDNGDLYFVVYGYMYNGENEGSFGAAVNYYNRMDGTYSEVLFIPYNKSFQMLEEGISRMAFMDGEEHLYLCLEDQIYRFDIVMKTAERIREQAGSESCSISSDGRKLVFPVENAQGKVTELEWTDLETGQSQRIQNSGSALRLIGMLGDNLVYGTESKEDAMDGLYIVDEQLQVLKEYHVDGGYISDARIREDMVEIHRKNSGGTELPEDYILYNENEDRTAEVIQRQQEFRRTESWMDLDVYGYSAPVVLYARPIKAYRDTEINFDIQNVPTVSEQHE